MSVARPTFAIECEHLTKVYGRHIAVDSISFRVEIGATVGFLGPNGAGKSTTIGMLLGLVRPTRGRLALFGSDPRTSRSSIQRRIGGMLERPAFPPRLTGTDALRALLALRGSDVSRSRCHAMLDRVGIGQHATKRVGTYSKGMTQRLTLAVALLDDPELLILDEPLAGLDPVGVRDVMRIFSDFADAGGTILLSSHHLGEVESLCDHVIIVSDGRLVYDGPTDGVASREATVRVLVRAHRQAERLLRDRGCEVSRDGAHLLVRGVSSERLSRLLADAGHYPIELSLERRPLTDAVVERIEGLDGR